MTQQMKSTSSEDDRELDGLVAERFEPKPPPPDESKCPLLLLERPETSEGGAWLHVHIFDHGDVCEWIPKAFSRDIASAMLVVEKMREKGFDVSMKHSEWTDNARRWLTEFEITDNYIVKAYGNASNDSLPRAICEAALAAIEATKNQR